MGEPEDFAEFNYFISEYFDTPAPAANVLSAVGVLMDWPAGDSKQLVTKMTGQRHTDDPKRPKQYEAFLQELRGKATSDLSDSNRERFKALLTESIAWKKFDHEAGHYNELTAMNSYDVLKCSQA